MKIALALIGFSIMTVSPSWALFESSVELVAATKITLEEAIHNALLSVPGKAVEAEIGKEDGRIVYEIEIVDRSNKAQTVYVDAQNGQTKIKE